MASTCPQYRSTTHKLFQLSEKKKEGMLKLTQSERPAGNSSEQNSLFFQVLFVFSLCVLAYVIIQKSTQSVTHVNEIERQAAKTAGGTDLTAQAVNGDEDNRAEGVIQRPEAEEPVVTQGPVVTQAPVVTTTTVDTENLLQNTTVTTPISVDIPNQTRRSYTVLRGDILGVISQKMYGTVKFVGNIVKANPELIDPDTLKEGMVLNIPALDDSSVGQLPAALLEGSTTLYDTYVVKQGDSIWSICERFFGNGSQQTSLMADNPELISDDGFLLRIGSKLRIRK
jgi:nucleoid-associated protein YgaU